MKCYTKLANILQHYLLVVRPAEAELVRVVKGPKEYRVYMEYLWTRNGSALTPELMYTSIADCTARYFDSPIGAQEYRQICVELGRVFIGSEYELRLEELDALASQAGHTINMAHFHYASEKDHHPVCPVTFCFDMVRCLKHGGRLLG